MKVRIVAWTQEFLIEVGVQEPVVEIKRKIEQFLKVPVAAQTLAVYGWELIDGLDMEDYPIVNEGTKIDLTINSNYSIPPTCIHNHNTKIHITIKFSARQINIEVDKTETVRSLKEKIHIMESIPIKRMSLFYSGIELQDDFRNLSEYGIHEFSEVVVFFKSMNRLRDDPPVKKVNFIVQTFSCLLNGARIPMELKDSNTVSDMKQQLLSAKFLPPTDYLFIHKQRIMRNDCSLRWHGVQNGETLFVFKGTINQSGH